ncbi:hypothetical protein Tco_1238883 [Tanacetum coccineum]
MKHWKSGFFLIDRRAIPDAMVWRHPNASINDPRSATGSFNMADMCCLSAHVIKLRDISKGVLVLSGLSQFWKNRFCDPMLQGADGNVMGIHDFLCLPEPPFYCIPSAAADAVIPNPTQEDLAAGTPSSKILAKPKLLRSERSLLLVPLQAMLAKGKGIMVDDAAAPSGGVSRQRPSSRPAPSFRDVSKGLLAELGWKSSRVYLEEAGFGTYDKLATSDASFSKSKAKGKERKKKIKSLVKVWIICILRRLVFPPLLIKLLFLKLRQSVFTRPYDVVMALLLVEKGDGSVLLYHEGGQGRVVCRRTLVAPSLGQTDCRCVVVHPVDPESCHRPYSRMAPLDCSIAGQAS